jgi:hypothetical protein
MSTVAITRSQLSAGLAGIRGSRIVTITATTIPDMRAGNPFGGRVRKTARVNGQINWRYTSAVQRRRNAENTPIDPATGEVAQFVAQPRKWGTLRTRADGTLTPFVDHKGAEYVELMVKDSLGYVYHLDNGQPLGAKGRRLVREWLRSKVEGARQMVARPVILRDYKLENITAVTHGKRTYVVNG